MLVIVTLTTSWEINNIRETNSSEAMGDNAESSFNLGFQVAQTHHDVTVVGAISESIWNNFLDKFFQICIFCIVFCPFQVNTIWYDCNFPVCRKILGGQKTTI
jgi:hypothetical protein